jgi:hypothetical protein
MKKHPKFMIALNPMVNPDDVYIFHSQRPRLLVKVEGDSYIVVDDIDDITSYYNGDVSKVEGLMRRMAEWHVAYKIHQRNGRIH